MSLARISRGRSIREFLLGVLLIPSGVSAVRFSILGGTAIMLERKGDSVYGDGNAEEQLFAMRHKLPDGCIAGTVVVVLLATVFITSADSASMVMGPLSQSGRSNANPWVSATWGALTALTGMTMPLSGGDNALDHLQNVTVTATAPFLIIPICLMFAIVKVPRNDAIYRNCRSRQALPVKPARERRLPGSHLEQEWRRARRRAARERSSCRARN